MQRANGIRRLAETIFLTVSLGIGVLALISMWQALGEAVELAYAAPTMVADSD
jgi:hypothetical protein